MVSDDAHMITYFWHVCLSTDNGSFNPPMERRVIPPRNKIGIAKEANVVVLSNRNGTLRNVNKKERNPASSIG
jgi:hypothetical protein